MDHSKSRFPDKAQIYLSSNITKTSMVEFQEWGKKASNGVNAYYREMSMAFRMVPIHENTKLNKDGLKMKEQNDI